MTSATTIERQYEDISNNSNLISSSNFIPSFHNMTSSGSVSVGLSPSRLDGRNNSGGGNNSDITSSNNVNNVDGSNNDSRTDAETHRVGTVGSDTNTQHRRRSPGSLSLSDSNTTTAEEEQEQGSNEDESNESTNNVENTNSSHATTTTSNGISLLKRLWKGLISKLLYIKSSFAALTWYCITFWLFVIYHSFSRHISVKELYGVSIVLLLVHFGMNIVMEALPRYLVGVLAFLINAGGNGLGGMTARSGIVGGAGGGETDNAGGATWKAISGTGEKGFVWGGAANLVWHDLFANIRAASQQSVRTAAASAVYHASSSGTESQMKDLEGLFTALTGISSPTLHQHANSYADVTPSLPQSESSQSSTSTAAISPLGIILENTPFASLILPPIILGIFLLITVLLFLLAHVFLQCLISSLSSSSSTDADTATPSATGTNDGHDGDNENANNNNNNNVHNVRPTFELSSFLDDDEDDLLDELNADNGSNEPVSSPLIVWAILGILLMETILPWISLSIGFYICYSVGGIVWIMGSILMTVLLWFSVNFIAGVLRRNVYRDLQDTERSSNHLDSDDSQSEQGH